MDMVARGVDRVGLNGVVSVGFPGMGVPVVAQSSAIRIVGIAGRSGISALRRVAAAGSRRGRGAASAIVAAACENRSAHQHGQKQSECLFHVFTSLTFPMKTDGGRNIVTLQNSGFMQVSESKGASCKTGRIAIFAPVNFTVIL